MVGVFSSTDLFIVDKIHLSFFLYFEGDSKPDISEIHEAVLWGEERESTRIVERKRQ